VPSQVANATLAEASSSKAAAPSHIPRIPVLLPGLAVRRRI
jgi:hypothetical protein